MPYNERTIPNADERNAFFDALDEMAGQTDFSPIPPAWYYFKVSVKEYSLSKSGAGMAALEMTVCNDEDGYDGRKVWPYAMLEGVDKNGRSQTWFLARLIKGLAEQYGRETAGEFVPFPGWQADKKFCIIPRDLDNNPDWTEWKQWFDRLSYYEILAEVMHKPGQSKGSDGKYKDDATKPPQADVKGFKVAEKA